MTNASEVQKIYINTVHYVQYNTRTTDALMSKRYPLTKNGVTFCARVISGCSHIVYNFCEVSCTNREYTV